MSVMIPLFPAEVTMMKLADIWDEAANAVVFQHMSFPMSWESTQADQPHENLHG